MAEQSNQTREQIVTAAMKLFADKGFHETSMAAIAERAGVGKGTLYWYFTSKDELFKQMITEKGESLYLQVQNLVQRKLPPVTSLEELIRIMLEFAAKERDLSKILLKSVQFTDQEFKQRLVERHIQMTKLVEVIVQQGIDAGTFAPGSAYYIAVSVIGMINGMTSVIYCSDEPAELEGMIAVVLNLMMNGLKASA